jgi:superfamily II DNA or RNA helicase
MSGTPDEFQRKFENRIEFSMKAAIQAGYILKPVFNVINAFTKEQFINGIISVYHKDCALRTREGERVKILVNCQSIDMINAVLNSDFIKDGLEQKKFHVITIHSDKKVKDNNNYEIIIKSTVDGKENSSAIIFENVINKIDNNTAFEDDLPIFLFQVDMLSEGLNLKSFSSAIISTDDARKFVQQMGRVIRLYDGKNSAHIYVMADTEDFSKNLLKNLAQAE